MSTNRIRSIVNKAISQGSPEKLNILTFNTHERYQTNQCMTGHNFYAFNWERGKSWLGEHAPMPDNYYQLPENSIVPGVTFDMILAHSKFGQLQKAYEINQFLQVPIVCVEHTLPLPNWTPEQFSKMQNIYGDVNVFITDYSKDQWNINAPSQVIYHGIDTKLFNPGSEERSGVLTVAHDFIKRDYALNYKGWERITQGLDRKVVGATEGLSEAAKNVEELVKAYQQAAVYINPSTLSPVPTSMLEAMACGCPVVSMDNCAISEFIVHEQNGYLSNDEEELRSWVKHLLDNPDVAAKMGNSARVTIEEMCDPTRFVSEWNNIFNQAYQRI